MPRTTERCRKSESLLKAKQINNIDHANYEIDPTTGGSSGSITGFLLLSNLNGSRRKYKS